MCTAQLLMFLLAIFRRAHSAFLLSAVTWKWGKCRLELAKHEPVVSEHISVPCPASGPGGLSNAFCTSAHPWPFCCPGHGNKADWSSSDAGTTIPYFSSCFKELSTTHWVPAKCVIISIQGKALVWGHYREILWENEFLRIFTSHYKKFYLCCFFFPALLYKQTWHFILQSDFFLNYGTMEKAYKTHKPYYFCILETQNWFKPSSASNISSPSEKLYPELQTKVNFYGHVVIINPWETDFVTGTWAQSFPVVTLLSADAKRLKIHPPKKELIKSLQWF